MNNKTDYTFDLLLKLELFATKRKKQKFFIEAIVSLLAAVLFLAATYFTNDSWDPLFIVCGLMSFSIALISTFTLIKSRKNVIAQGIGKLIHDNPRKRIEYQFGEEYIQADVYSDQEQSSSKIKYSYVSEVKKIDDQTCFFITKGFKYYIIHDEYGIDGYFSYISEKI